MPDAPTPVDTIPAKSWLGISRSPMTAKILGFGGMVVVGVITVLHDELISHMFPTPPELKPYEPFVVAVLAMLLWALASTGLPSYHPADPEPGPSLDPASPKGGPVDTPPPGPTS